MEESLGPLPIEHAPGSYSGGTAQASHLTFLPVREKPPNRTLFCAGILWG